MVKNQTTNPELFPLELFVTLQIDADPWTGLRRAQRRVAGGLLPVRGRRNRSSPDRSSEDRFEACSKPRESLEDPPCRVPRVRVARQIARGKLNSVDGG